jgi:flagellar export protein FliJ
VAVFRFRLDRVLEQRRRAERERQRAVAELERERTEIEDAIRRRQAMIEDAKRGLRDALAADPDTRGARVDLRAARLQAGASIHQVMQTQQLVLQLAGVHKRLDAARATLLEAATRRKAVETLRDRALRRWLDEEHRRENAMLDELGTAQWIRRRAARDAGELTEGAA